MKKEEKIAEIEAKALESEQIAASTSDNDVCAYHKSLARELREFATKLKAQAIHPARQV